MSNYQLGLNAKAYAFATPITAGANSDYATALAAGVVFSNLTDVTVSLQTDTTDITTRANSGWAAEAATLKKGKISFEMLWKPADSNFGIIKTAWLANAEIFFGALDQAYTVSGAQGPAGNWNVTSFTRNEKLNGALTVSVELAPSSFNGWFIAT